MKKLISLKSMLKIMLVASVICLSLVVRADSISENKPAKCAVSAIDRSSAAIVFILDDISSFYSHTGGGGISQIREYQTNKFEVFILQEERVDILRYQLSINKDCSISLVEKEASVKSYSDH